MKSTPKRPGAGKRNFLWCTDPWEWMYHPQDTTMRLAREAELLGHDNYWLNVKTIRLEERRIVADIHRLAPATTGEADARGGPMARGEMKVLPPAEFDCIQWRMDPPVDHTYHHPLQLLLLGVEARAATRRPEIINPAPALFAANEKMEPALLGDLMPPTVVSSQWSYLSSFGMREGQTVLKPLDWCQSKGIELLDWRTPDACASSRETLKRVTDGFKRPVLLQRFLAGIKEGEKRLWFLDGKLLAHAVKYPLPGDFRVNIDRGSRLEMATLTKQEKATIPAISKRLRARGIRLAAVDLIEAKISDFNFTSPGLLTQMEALTGENLARKVMKALSRPRR